VVDSPTKTAQRWLITWASVAVVAVALVFVTIAEPYTVETNELSIRSDGLGYHVWTRAVLERNLNFCRFENLEFAIVEYGSTDNDGQALRCGNKYPPGLALLRFPVMGPVVALVDPGPITTAEDHANRLLSALALLSLCVLAVDAARRLGARPLPTHVALLAFVFGTGLFHYATYDASFTHIYTAFLVAALIWLGVRARTEPSRPWYFAPAAAASAFFIVSIRNINLVVLVVLLAGYLIWCDSGTGPWRSRLRRAALEAAPLAIGVAAAIVLQVGLNYYFAREIVLSSYGEEDFLFDRPKHWPVVLSYERGLLTYYPVVAVALVAGLWARRTRIATLWWGTMLVGLVVVYGFWEHWFLGGGFGHRGFVDVMPFGIVLFAVALTSLPRWAATTTTIAATLCAFVTLELMLGYWDRTYPFAGATPDQYWDHIAGSKSLFR
jgi:hypothetical protein